MTISIAAGLTDAEVAARVAEGKTNDVPTRASRSVGDIVRANVFTRIMLAMFEQVPWPLQKFAGQFSTQVG